MPIYIGAFLISLAMFLAGVYIGSLIDNSNLSSISGEVSGISERVASMQLLLLSEGNSSAFCPVYKSELDSIDSEVERVGYKLSYLEEEKNVYDNELKKKYFVLEAESYLLSKKIKSVCGGDDILLINFYSNKDCQRCREQGYEVLKARDELSNSGMNVKLFSFDGELGSPVAEAFSKEYNVSSYPTLIINEKTYPGFRDSSQLQSIIRALG